MPLELRHWFKMLTAVLGVAASYACWFIISSALDPRAASARLALVLLVLGAALAFRQLFATFLPLVLTKIWPRLDS